MVAYSGEAGEVAVFKERMLQDNRMRRAHTAVAGVPHRTELNTGAVRVLSQL